MSDFPTFTSVYVKHRWTRTGPKRVRCTGCDWTAELTDGGKSSVELVAQHVEQVWLDVRTIRTLEQLNSLPEQTVILNLMFGVVFELAIENDGTAAWYAIHSDVPRPSVTLPALLIHHPQWARS